MKKVSCYARWQAGRQQAVGDLMASNYYDYLHCRNIINTSGGRRDLGAHSSPVIPYLSQAAHSGGFVASPSRTVQSRGGYIARPSRAAQLCDSVS